MAQSNSNSITSSISVASSWTLAGAVAAASIPCGEIFARTLAHWEPITEVFMAVEVLLSVILYVPLVLLARRSPSSILVSAGVGSLFAFVMAGASRTAFLGPIALFGIGSSLPLIAYVSFEALARRAKNP